jgi:hypothetical protein
MHVDAGELLVLLEQDLCTSGWDGSYIPYPGQSAPQLAMMQLRKSLVKKYLPGTSDKNEAADSRAMELFAKANETCRCWQLDLTRCSDLEVVAIGEMKSLIDSFFYPDLVDYPDNIGCEPTQDDLLGRNTIGGRDFILSQNCITSGFGLGNGSNIGSPETDLYSKLARSSMAATSSALHRFYVDAVSGDPEWLCMELSRAAKMGYQTVSGSCLSFVPKTTEISRTICTEPILNMIFQKGIARSLEQRLREVFAINLSTQPEKNADFARLGSLTGRFGTIDLSSASDTISKNLCRYLLPKRAYDVLEMARSPVTTLPSGETIELHMISSMGNAFTFPLQTMIFAAVVYGCYRAYDIDFVRSRGRSLGNFAVFGDDIIVEQRSYDLVCRVLTLLGFSVNVDKSFNIGGFRESCGSDYFEGHNIRGVYIKRLRDANDCYSAINRLVRWSAKHGVMLTSLVAFLVRKCRFLPIPYDEGDDMGIKVPMSLLTLGQQKILHRDTGGTMYRVSRVPGRVVSMLQDKEGNLKNGWYTNPAGLLKAFLAGNIRDGSVVLRTSRRRANIRKRYSSRWDYVPSARDESREYAASWKSAAEILLSK